LYVVSSTVILWFASREKAWLVKAVTYQFMCKKELFLYVKITTVRKIGEIVKLNFSTVRYIVTKDTRK